MADEPLLCGACALPMAVTIEALLSGSVRCPGCGASARTGAGATRLEPLEPGEGGVVDVVTERTPPRRPWHEVYLDQLEDLFRPYMRSSTGESTAARMARESTEALARAEELLEQQRQRPRTFYGRARADRVYVDEYVGRWTASPESSAETDNGPYVRYRYGGPAPTPWWAADADPLADLRAWADRVVDEQPVGYVDVDLDDAARARIGEQVRARHQEAERDRLSAPFRQFLDTVPLIDEDTARRLLSDHLDQDLERDRRERSLHQELRLSAQVSNPAHLWRGLGSGA